MRYAWETCPNPDVLVLHVTVEMPRMHLDEWAGDHLDDKVRDDEDRAFAAALLAVPGVVTAYVSKYQVQVCRGPLFPWAEICPGVVEVVRGRFAPNVTPVAGVREAVAAVR